MSRLLLRLPPTYTFLRACNSSQLSFSLSSSSTVHFRPYLSCQTRAQSGQTTNELGLQSTHPPEPIGNDNQDITDQEWELRTGRAIYILTQTLPTFFSTGLVTVSTDAPIAFNPKPLAKPPDGHIEVDSIYSPRIRLEYTPPVALPAPFPQTLHIEGLPLYMASSVFVRHTLNALYANLHVELRRVDLQTTSRALAPSGSDKPGCNGNTSREKSISVGLFVRGIARVSGGVGEWEIDSTHTFSPKTGLIHMHRIDSIRPEPHQAVYNALRASLVNVFGLGEHQGACTASEREVV